MIARAPYQKIPVGVIVTVLMISFIGSVNLASSSQATNPKLYLIQLAWLGLSIVAAVIVVRIPTHTIEFMAYPIYVVVNFLLGLVLVSGVIVKGAQRWLDLGFFRLQPSELAKLMIIIVVARYFSRYRMNGGYTLRALFRPLNVSRPALVGIVIAVRWSAMPAGENLFSSTWLMAGCVIAVSCWAAVALVVLWREGLSHQRVMAPVDLLLVPFSLVVIEPDLGTSLIVLSIAIVQIIFCGVRRGSLILAFIMGLGVVLGGWNYLLKDYQRKRVEIFLNPESDLQGAGYHASQSIIAIGSGELTGKGLYAGTQTQLSFLPENHTDFVFSVLAEEWGFVGCSVLIFLYIMLVLGMLRSSRESNDRFASLVNIGAAAMIFWHVFINIGMVTALLPVVGVTLPFMSYGGSSLITQTIAVALVVNTSYWRRG